MDAFKIQEKASIQALIAKTTDNQDGPILNSPSLLLGKHPVNSSLDATIPSPAKQMKKESAVNNANTMSTSTLAYIEAFSNPYVKISLLCVVCGKGILGFT